MMLEVWRAVTWPFVATIFWWVAGRSMEALLAARKKNILPRVSWFELLLAFAAMLYTSLIIIALTIEGSAEDQPIRAPVLIFGIMWIMLGSCTFAARFMQWRLRKRLATGPALAQG
jgi:hypothetical protein